MSFNLDSWVNFNLRTSASFDRLEEVEKLTREKLATSIQRNIRTRVDPGIDRKSGVAAEAVKVKSDGNRFIIYAESHAEVLGVMSKKDTTESQGVEDLFKTGSGVPDVQTRADGTTSLTFKKISLNNLFSEQKRSEQRHMNEQSVTETVRSGIVNAYEESFAEVDRRNPSGT